MAQPGINFEEAPVRTAVRPASADIGGMLHKAKRGRTDKPLLCNGWKAFEEFYGGFNEDSDDYDLARAYSDFLENGGERAYLLRIAGADAAQAMVSMLGRSNTAATINAYAHNVGDWGNRLSVESIRTEVNAVGDPAAADADFNDLPLTKLAGSKVFQLTLESVTDVRLGDVLDIFDPDTRARALVQPIVVADIIPASKGIRFVYVTANIGDIPTGALLRTNSNHRAATFATAQLSDQDTSIELDSVEGIGRGTVLTLSQCAHYHMDSGTPVAVATELVAVVDRVVGKRVYFTAALGTDNAEVVLPATYAEGFLDGDTGLGDNSEAGTEVSVKAAQSGPAGNGISVSFVHDLDAVGIEIAVVGRAVTITVDGVNDGNTWNAIKAAVAANARAAALITLEGASATLVPLSDDQTTVLFSLTGGARLNVVSQEFELALFEDGRQREVGAFQFLSMVSTSRDYIGKRFGGVLSGTIYNPADNNPSNRLILVDAAVAGADAILDQPAATATLALANGDDGTAPDAEDFKGVASPKSGIYLFDLAPDMALMCAAGQDDLFFSQALIDYAEGRGDIAVLLDAPAADEATEELLRNYKRLTLSSNSTYAGLYAPRQYVRDPRQSARPGDVVINAASPIAMGLTIRRTREEGASRSAGNTVPRAVAPTVAFSAAEHGRLNDDGINIIRVVGGMGLRLFGDRTLGYTVTDGRQFFNVRRWLNYFKRSLATSLTAYPFMPATYRTMELLANAVGKFLFREWEAGALFPDDNSQAAYMVKADDETTTPDDLAEGRLNCLCKVSPVTPAEQINFQIESSVGGIRVAEG